MRRVPSLGKKNGHSHGCELYCQGRDGGINLCSAHGIHRSMVLMSGEQRCLVPACEARLAWIWRA
jgi:hypothetical protein